MGSPDKSGKKRPPGRPKSGRKKPITVNIGPRMKEWVESQCGDGKPWEGRSEAFRKVMAEYMAKKGVLADPEGDEPENKNKTK